MPKEITLPKLSEDADEGKVAEVIVKVGDTIKKDDEIIAVESDKATVEVPSPEAGTVKEIKVSEGDSIRTGDVILLLEDESPDEDEAPDETDEEKEKGEQPEEKEQKEDREKAEEEKEEKKAEAEEKDEEKKTEQKETEKRETKTEKEESEEKRGAEPSINKKEEKETEQKSEEREEKKDELGENGEKEETEPKSEVASEEGKGTEKEIPAAPGARRLAREEGVDLREIQGSGSDGLITEDDVRKSADVSEPSGPEKSTLPDFSKWGEVERKPLSEVRKATAKQTTQSWQAIPHVTQFDEADVGDIQKYIEEHASKAEEKGGKLTITAILVKLAAEALRQFPKFNASIDMENKEMILKKYVHVAVAVDTDDGLLMPVIRHPDRKSITDIAVEITDAAEKAREEELSADDLKGGNFAVSNLGGIGGTQFTPVIYHPNVAILGASEITVKPVFIDGNFQPRKTLPLSLSYDHRLIDGAEGVRFLRFICNALEDPYKALFGE